MPIRVKTGASSWANVSQIRVKTGASSWANVIAGRVKTGISTWVNFFTLENVPTIQSTVTISQSTNGTTGLVTLTGTNRHWLESPTSLLYRFEWSSDSGYSYTTISTASITNPSFGSNNTKTYTVPTQEVLANQNNLYRFIVTATNSTGSSTSTSGTTSIQGPTNITLSAGTPTSTTIPLSWNDSTGANRYMVYRSTNNSTFTLIAGTSSISTTATGLSPNTLYYFKVMSITGTTNDTGYYGNFSNTVSATTSLLAAYNSTFGTNTSVSGGFNGVVNNYSATFSYSISTSAGSVSFTGSPNINNATYNFAVTGLSSGQSATVTVATTNASYNPGSGSTTGSAIVVVSPPVNNVAPIIAPTSGTAGSTTYSVTNNGSWSNSPTGYNYQWQYNDQGSTFLNIPGETSSSYSPPANFFSYYTSPILCRVTAFNAGGNSVSPANSNQATVSAPGVAPNGGGVTLSPSGTQQAGTTITANVSAMSGTATITHSTTLRKKTGSAPTSSTDGTQVASGTGTGNVCSHVITDSEASGTPDQFRAFTTGTNGFGNNTVLSNTVISTPAVVTQYTISWDANGGSVSPGSNTVNSGTTVSAPTPTRSGYTFLYWRDSLSQFSYTYQINPGGSWTVTSNITFYAYWQIVAVAGPAITSGPSISWASGNNFTLSATASNATNIEFQVQFGNNDGGPVLSTQTFFMGASAGSRTTGAQQYSWARTRARANNTNTNLSSEFSGYTEWA